MSLISVSKEIKGEIMNTDVYCEILCETDERPAALQALDIVFDQFQNFATRFSRFRRDNELWAFNESVTMTLSADLFALLTQAQKFFLETGGLFDPAILPHLEREGYPGAYAAHPEALSPYAHFTDLTLDTATRSVTKPASLKIDLGGIGKGFIIDAVSAHLTQRYRNFLVDAGGDLYAHGANQLLDYPYWAIDVENPSETPKVAPVLMLHDMAAATSGTNRRRWSVAGAAKHHLIDPKTGQSSSNELIAVTVVAPDAASADVWAKTLFLAGEEQRTDLIAQHELPAIFLHPDGHQTLTPYIEQYVWKS